MAADAAALAEQLACCGQQLEPAEQRAQVTLFRLLAAEVESVCPTTGLAISLRVDAHGPRDVAPADAVLSFRRAGPVFADGVIDSFCRYVHFFASAAAAEPWIAQHPGTFVISLATGFEVGRRTNAAQFGTARGGPTTPTGS